MRRSKISKKTFIGYLFGKLSDEELNLHHKENEKEREQLVFIKRQLEHAQVKKPLSLDSAWKQVRQSIRPQKKLPRKGFVPSHYMRYAAAIILLLGIGFTLTTIYYGKKDGGTGEGALLTDKPMAYLELSDGRTVDLEATTNQLFKDGAASISFSQQNISYSSNQSSQKADELRMNKLKVPKQSDYRLTLSDGTIAWLNSESEIEFPVHFGKGDRRIKLKGEAYFEVSKQKDGSRFIIETEKGDVEVLGTTFNVSAYENDKVWHVTLVEGVVNVRRKSGIYESAQLKPSQQFLIEGDAKAEIKTVDTYLYTSWREGVFAFENMSLSEIAERLERWYDVEIHFQDSISAGERYTGLFKKNESVNDVVNTILSANKVRLKFDGKQINISSKSNMH